MVRHKVNDYKSWKEAFDNFVDFRRSSGEKSFQILQHDEDSQNLFLLFEWDSADNAQKFFDSPDLKSTMEKAGVAEEPEINFLSESARGVL
jgi:heme-degrading monooxygenase HmoA